MTAETLNAALQESSLAEDDVVGTHTYEDALFTGPGDVGVINVLTDAIPAGLDRSVEHALQHARSCSTDQEYVARRSNNEESVEMHESYTACVFYHFNITGTLEWHKAFGAAIRDDAYTVTHEANYSTGTVTITVARTNDGRET